MSDILSLKYHLIDPHVDDREATARVVVETPRGSRHKFALEPDVGAIMLKATLASGLAWPYDYGFVPRTKAGDGDPLDILVLMDHPSFPGCVMNVRILGYIGLTKNGERNDRFVGCLPPSTETSLSTDGYASIEDLPEKLIGEMQRFLKNYSEQRGNAIELTGIAGREDALSEIARARRAFEDAAEG